MEREIVLVDKPVGWTSFDVVAKIRSRIRERYRALGNKPTKRQLRVGHTGTLDPFATGLLVILLGDACKRSVEFLKQDKVYEAVLALGSVSTTGDPEGEVTPQSDHVPTLQHVTDVLVRFHGEISQIPPAYSAIKINGRRAYDLARAGEVVVMTPRQVTVYELELLDYTYPSIRIRAHVSSGTYIRTLAEDIGRELGTGAYCHELRRIKIGNLSVDDAVAPERVLVPGDSHDDTEHN